MGTPYTSANNNYYVTDGLFRDTNWVHKYATCYTPLNPDCDMSNLGRPGISDRRPKRYFLASNAPTLSPVPVIAALYQRSNSVDFTPWITGNAHNGIHGFTGFSMGRTRTAGDDPIFWIHHCNVDRFLAMWADCNEYDRLNPNTDLRVPRHFNQTSQHRLDTQIRFSSSSGSNRPPPFISTVDYPTSRQLWTMGTATSPGWQGLYYRYGFDRLVSSALSTVCPGNTWTWVNQVTGTQKRSETDSGDLLYKNITRTFLKYTEEKGMSPQEAVNLMEWEDCKANPLNITAYQRSVLKSFGIPLKNLKRVCDKDEDFEEDEDEVHHHM
jgi:hypothetical protein